MKLLKPRHLLLLLALILAGALATIVALRYRPAVELAEVVKALPSGVDLALQDINYTHSEAGVARWRLVAKQVQHRAEPQGMVVADLQLTFFDAAGIEQGTLTARNGQVDADFSVVEVRGEVQIVSRNGYTLQTEHLTYRQQDRSIRTDAPVRLVSAEMQLDGVGLTLDLATQRLQVHDKVRAVVKAQPRKRESS
jgi:LPS export ABC transporter protein LptC